MFTRKLLFGLLCVLLLAAPAAAQEAEPCNPQLPPRLGWGVAGIVTVTDNPTPLRVRAEPSTSAEILTQLEEGTEFIVAGFDTVCAEGITWWQIQSGDVTGWIAEGVGDRYFVEPFSPALALPSSPVPLADAPPQITDYDFPLPAVTPQNAPAELSDSFAPWQWPPDSFLANEYNIPDPRLLELPDAYRGGLPSLPVDLSSVAYLEDAPLSDEQLRLLAQNGFIVVPAEAGQFEQTLWVDPATGRSDFITTDMFLHNLYLIYRYTLMYLETGAFFNTLADLAMSGYQAAERQLREAEGTPLEDAARGAAVYYGVLLALLSDAESAVSFDGIDWNDPESMTSGFYGQFITAYPWEVQIAPDILVDVQPIADAAREGQGTAAIPFLTNYAEDFGLYRPRSHYTNDELLSAYFRAVTWLGRITFSVERERDQQTGLMVLRAMAISEGALQSWRTMNETLEFLIGPTDSINPDDALPRATSAFGAGLPLDALADSERQSAYREALAELPPPTVNNLLLPQGTSAEDMRAEGRGFRLMGGRYTLDGSYIQRLIDPDVPGRALPTGLDLAAALGSDTAYGLVVASGAADYADYTPNMVELREETNGLSPDDWMENVYGGWLWALQPLLVRDPALEPMMMQTDAWRRKDLTTMLASWAALKNATAAYVIPPGGLGGGGEQPPLTTYTVVEPNPLVFARIAVLSTILADGLEARGLTSIPLTSVIGSARQNASLAALAAEVARQQMSGEPVPEEVLRFFQAFFRSNYMYVRIGMEQFDGNPPRNTAMTAVGATSPAGYLQVSTGLVDYLYVIADRPEGLQLVRGGVYSYYEFVNGSGQPLTDEEWRTQIDNGTAEGRAWWADFYTGE